MQFSELRLELALVHKRISPLFSRNSRKFYFAHVPKCGKFAYEFHRVLWENLSRGSYRESIEAKSSLNLRICNFVRSSNGRRWKNSYQLWRWGMIEGTNERDDNIYLSPRKKINILLEHAQISYHREIMASWYFLDERERNLLKKGSWAQKSVPN